MWVGHYRSVREADEAFGDGVRLFYPVPAILYDRGSPFYSYYAYLAKTQEEPAAPAECRAELNENRLE